MASLFNIPSRSGRCEDAKIAKRINTTQNKSTMTVKGGGGLIERINLARAVVDRNLGKYRDEYLIIREEEQLSAYITKSVDNGIISIDTETTGLDPLQDSIVGISMYTPGLNAAYVPINHKSYITGDKVENQLNTNFIASQLQRLVDFNTKIIMFNACFDIRVIRNNVGTNLSCYWDCYLGARLLNENEGAGNNNLKALYQKYCADSINKEARFSDIFDGIQFDFVPINLGYLYAAHDAKMTYELYEFQRPYLTQFDDVCVEHGLQDVAWVFMNIEMPCVDVVADMEDTGVSFDYDVADSLHTKYHKLLEEKTKIVYDILSKYEYKISEYKSKNTHHKLSEPINLDSPTQIAIVLYDIMCVKPVDSKSPRGTGESILVKIDNDFTRALLEYRGVVKLINTYIDKLPMCVNKSDGRVHCKFNQYGADTGRMSSNDPNLQNIPSHNKDIRKMFKATDGYVLMSSDFSQQEQLDFVQVSRWCEVEVPYGFKYAHDLKVGDKLLFDDKSIGCIRKVDYTVDKSQILLYYNVEGDDIV